MSEKQDSSSKPTKLVGIDPLITELFTDPSTRPSKRTVLEWKAKGWIPFVRIGRRIFYYPAEVEKSIKERFSVPTID